MTASMAIGDYATEMPVPLATGVSRSIHLMPATGQRGPEGYVAGRASENGGMCRGEYRGQSEVIQRSPGQGVPEATHLF
jgi:hypothetical protein